jgi:hypothetical protein
MKNKYSSFRWLMAITLGLFLVFGPFANAQDGRSIAGSFINGVTVYYSPGVDGLVLDFETHVVSPDGEWVVYAELDFPDGVTVVSATNMVFANRLLPFNGESGDGALLTWGNPDTYPFPNYLVNGNIATFSVTVNVEEAFSGDLVVDWLLQGDVWGADPHTVNGTVSFEEVPFPYPVDFVIASQLSDEMVMLEWGFDLEAFIPDQYPFNTDGMTEYDIQRNWQSYLSYIGVNSNGTTADGRQLVEFQVWRQRIYQPATAQLLGTTSQTQFVDFGWGGVEWGVYEWQIVAVYELNQSEPVSSNPLDKDMRTTVNVQVQTNSGDSPAGALVEFTNTSELNEEGEPQYTFTTMMDESGMFTWNEFRRGVYDVEISLAGFGSIAENGLEIFDESSFYWLLIEILAMPQDLYVTPTGYATWSGGTVEPSPFEPFFESFEDAAVGMALPEGWEKIPMTNNWRIVQNDFQGTAGGEGPEMKFYWSPRYADGDRYARSPVNNTSGQSELEFSFKAYLNNFNATSYPYTIRFVTIADGVEYVIDELVPEGNINIDAQTYAYTLTSGAHGVGAEEFYLAWVYDGGPNNDAFGVNGFFVDDIVLTTNRGAGVHASREFINYKVFLNGILVAETGDTQYQFGTNGEVLVDGQTYTTDVVAVFSTGQSAPASYTWVYVACDNYDAPGSFMAAQVEGTLDVALSWTVPTLDPEDDQIDFARIFRNGDVIAELMADSYLDAQLDIGSYEYCITFVYESGAETCQGTLCQTVDVTGNASVNGTVVQAMYLGGEPIEGAMITIYNDTDSFSYTTDANGVYDGTIQAGTYNYLVTAGGYVSDMLEGIMIPEAGTVTHDFVLMEFPYPVSDVVAIELTDNTVEIRWRPPSTFEPFLEDFNDGLPDDWSVELGPNATAPQNWMHFVNTAARPLTGTPYMVIDSDAAGSGAGTLHGILTSPVINAQGADELFVTFDQYYRHLGATSYGNVEVFDGTDWVTVLNQTVTSGTWTAPNQRVLDVTAYANSNFQVRFNYTDGGSWSWYWAVDNVAVTDDVTRLQPDPTLEGYRVYRTSCEEGGNMQFLGFTLDTTFNDNTWGTAASGVYRWGVEAVYAENMSEVMFSNCLDKNMTTFVSVTVQTNSGDSPEGTNVLFVNTSEPHLELSYAVELDASGYFMWDDFRKGTYDISVELLGFAPLELSGVVINIPMDFSWILQELLLPVGDLHVTPTGFATWRSGAVIPFEPYIVDWSQGEFDEWTRIPATANWQMSNTSLAGGAVPEVRFYWSPNTLNRFYFLSPMMSTLTQTQLELSFKQFIDHYGGPYTLQLVTIANGVEYLVDEWVNPSANIPAHTYTTLLTTAHGVGADEFQIGFVYDGQAWNINWWNIDDIMLYTPGSRELLSYSVYLDGVYVGSTTDEFYQYEGLTDGQTYLAEVAAVYTTGVSPRMAYTFTYLSCENFPGPDGLTAEVENINNVVLTWGTPEPPPPGEAFFEGFEGAFPPAGWAKINPDGGSGWVDLAAGTTPIPGWTGGVAEPAPDGGAKMAFCTWDTGGPTSNNQWLVTPQITTSAGDVLMFHLRYWPDTYSDNVDIRISTTSQTDPAAFDIVVAQLTFGAGSSLDWELYTYNLADFVSPGTPIYIAFREHVADNFNDGAAIFLDNVYVGAPTTFATGGAIAHNTGDVERDLNYRFVDPDADAAGGSSHYVADHNRDMFDLLYSFPVGVGGGEYSVATDGEYIYTAAWNSTTFYRYELDGTFIGSFTIPGAGNIRDLTYDGEFFYGAPNTTTIYQMDFTNQTLAGTITAPAAVRGIAYDAENDGFWVTSGWDPPIRLISRTGTVLQTLNTTASSFSGLAWENVTDGSPYLWAYTQPASNNILVQINPTTGATIQTFDVATVAPIGAGSISGGMVITDLLVEDTWAFLGTSQNDIIWVLELHADDGGGGGGGGGAPLDFLGANIYRNGELIAEMVQGETYTDAGVEPGYYDYCVRFVYEEGAESCPGEACVFDVLVTEDCVAPVNLTAFNPTEGQPGPQQVDLVWNEMVAQEFRYDDGVRTAQLGFQGGTINSVLGAKHSVNATLTEMSWLLSDEPDAGGPHATVQIYVFGLTGAGLPDGTNVLYTASVSNTDGIWNTHTFPNPVDAPTGFFLGVAYNGFVGLGTDDGIGAPWQFIPNTHYFVSDYTAGGWATWESAGFSVNGMIRAMGVPNAVVSHLVDEHYRPEGAQFRNPAENLVYSKLDVPAEYSEPNWSQEHYSAPRAFVGYNIYYKMGESGTYEILEALWPETNYSYIEAREGVFYYMVTAEYEYCGESDPSNEVMVSIITSVDEISATDATRLYPNPASNSIIIEAPEMRRITIVNALGQVVYDADVNSQTRISLNTASFEAGIYMVRIATVEGMVTKRLTIVR